MDVRTFYGRHPATVKSAIIKDFELIAYRKDSVSELEEADTVRGFASAIV